MADKVERVYDDIDKTIRTSVFQILVRHGDAGNSAMALHCLVPAICSVIDTLGKTLPERMRQQWAVNLRMAADDLVTHREMTQ